MALPDRAGRFRGYPQEWGIEKSSKSESVAFVCLWRLTEFWDPAGKAWCDYTQIGAEITGRTYFVKADGSPSPNGVDQLKRSLGWTGDVIALQTTDWTSHGCQLTIEHETFQGKTKLKVQWLDAWDATPGGVTKMDGSDLAALQTRLGGQLRATAGPQTQGGSAPPGRPPPPPVSKPAPPPAGVQVGTGGDVDEKDIPFAWIGLLGGAIVGAMQAVQAVSLV